MNSWTINRPFILGCLLSVGMFSVQAQKEYDYGIKGVYNINPTNGKDSKEEKVQYSGTIRMKVKKGMYKDWLTPHGFDVVTLYSSAPDIDDPMLPESFELGVKEQNVDNLVFGVRVLASHTFNQGGYSGLAFSGVPTSNGEGWHYAYILTYQNKKTDKYTRIVKILVQAD